MNTIQTTKRALRRFLLEKQLLLQPRTVMKLDHENRRQLVLDVIRRLECIQIDPVSAVRPNQHLVLSARIAGYEPEIVHELLRGNALFEYYANAACLIPMEHFPMLEPVRSRMRAHTKEAIDALQPVAAHVLDKLKEDGPLPSKAFESDQRVHGYWDNTAAKTKATSHALNLLTDAAYIRIVGREGNQRLFHLTEQSVPGKLLEQAGKLKPEEASRQLLLKYFRAYRVFEPSDSRFGWQRFSAAERRGIIGQCGKDGLITAVEADGVKQPYYILSSDRDELLRQEEAISAGDEETITFLPPLDNVCWSRKRLEDLFDFEYRWEIYTPAVKRKYGYYAMPILAGDRLIGRMDPRLDRKQGVLRVQLLQLDASGDGPAQADSSMMRALEAFAQAHGATDVIWES
ncbi:winged helix-turn-helix domain-containing protein [Paenibacillus protaetiae]|uniref:Winged helix-turn-helix domain-containing protein n=1 Tax=Paenibacillus protaetiae TaxID=2509456 RepID=A0A4P6ETJ6_9BACL|nr:crosslink repair DNA glycosylase YcaQ family protein [Paenibacillus protaetiae]QAY65765.1 winged helix-turn-helix domain-containing protein [Paenibacillus protaetiae]